MGTRKSPVYHSRIHLLAEIIREGYQHLILTQEELRDIYLIRSMYDQAPEKILEQVPPEIVRQAYEQIYGKKMDINRQLQGKFSTRYTPSFDPEARKKDYQSRVITNILTTKQKFLQTQEKTAKRHLYQILRQDPLYQLFLTPLLRKELGISLSKLCAEEKRLITPKELENILAKRLGEQEPENYLEAKKIGLLTSKGRILIDPKKASLEGRLFDMIPTTLVDLETIDPKNIATLAYEAAKEQKLLEMTPDTYDTITELEKQGVSAVPLRIEKSEDGKNLADAIDKKILEEIGGKGTTVLTINNEHYLTYLQLSYLTYHLGKRIHEEKNLPVTLPTRNETEEWEEERKTRKRMSTFFSRG